MSETPIPNPPLSAAERAVAAALSSSELGEIDHTLLSHSRTQWTKVAMVVMKTLGDMRDRHPGLTDLFYAERLQHLVANAKLESQGNITVMRFSEVRLPQSANQPE
jgi:hypothetical protein